MSAADGGCGCDSAADTITGGGYEKSAAAFGRVYSVVGAIIGAIIAIILIIMGISRLRDPHTTPVAATVTAVRSCAHLVQGGTTTYSCVVSAAYAVGGSKYVVKDLKVVRDAPLAAGAALTLYYDPSNPKSAVYERLPRGAGWGLVGFGVLVGGLTAGIAFMTFKSKGFAAAYGTVEGISLVARAV